MKPLASSQAAVNASAHLFTFAAYFVMGKKDRPFASETKLGVYHSNFYQYHRGKGALSNANKFAHISKEEKQVL